MTVLWTLFPLLPAAGAVAVATAIALLTAVAFRRRVPDAAALGVFCTACFVAMLCGIRLSQVWLAIGLAACVAAARVVPWMRDATGWLRVGAFGRDIQMLCVASAVIAAGALLLWFTLLRPDVADIVAQFFPPAPGYVRPKYFTWASLLERTFAIDVLACLECGGRLRLIATITDASVIDKILTHLGLATEAPAPLPAKPAGWLSGVTSPGLDQRVTGAAPVRPAPRPGRRLAPPTSAEIA